MDLTTSSGSSPRPARPSTPRDSQSPRGRSRPLRIEREGQLYFVTTRTIEARFWLHPFLTCGLKLSSRGDRRAAATLDRAYDKRVKRMVSDANRRMGPHQPRLTVDIAKRILKGLVGSALARAQEHCREKGMDVDVFAFVAMSNHLHLVLRTSKKNLAAFMGYFKARIAESVNYVTGKRGPLFARRYDAQPILNDDAAAGRVAYTIDNPRAANLVAHHDDWPGLLLCFGLADTDAPTFEYLARTAWHNARRPEDIGRFFQDATLKLSPLPRSESVSREVYRLMIDEWVCARRDNNPDANVGRKKPPLGIDAILNAAFNARPTDAKRSRRPYAFGTPDELSDHYERCSNTIKAFNAASDEYRSGNRHVTFPDGTYVPAMPYAA